MAASRSARCARACSRPPPSWRCCRSRLALGFVTRRVTQQAEVELRREPRGGGPARRAVPPHAARPRRASAPRSWPTCPSSRPRSTRPTRGTAEPVARDYRERVRADVLVVADRDGAHARLARDGRRVAGRAAAGARSAGGRRRLLETVDVPILLGAEAPEVLGHLTLGFALDDAVRRAAARAHRQPRGGGARTGASSPRRLPREQDAALLARAPGPGRGRDCELGGEEYVAPAGPPWAARRARPSSSCCARAPRRCGLSRRCAPRWSSRRSPRWSP